MFLFEICILKLSGLPELQPGTLLKGLADGKFEDGYFVTMKTGSHELKGVVYRNQSVAAIDAATAAVTGDATEAETEAEAEESL